MTRPGISRRQFLQTTGGILAAPYAFALTGAPPPSDRLSVGFIGVGNMGSGHLGGFLGNSDVQVVAVCDVKSDKLEAAAHRIEGHYAEAKRSGRYLGLFRTSRYEEVLARDDIYAVLIAVPDHWHAMIAIAACRAGKDVYCEKPLSLTIGEAQGMLSAARRYGTVFQTGSQQRSSSNFRLACELVQSGRIGNLSTVHVNIGKPSTHKQFVEEPIPDTIDWERWLGPAPWSPYNAERCSGSYSGGWRMVRDYSGGMTTDWGAHHIDIAQWGMGMDGNGPVLIEPPSASPFNTLTYTYANGVKLIRSDRTEEGQAVNGVLFSGSEGKIEVNRGHFRCWPEGLDQEPIGKDGVQLYKSVGHVRDWLDCIKTRRRPICDVAIGASSVTVCHLGNIASWCDRPIRWDPQQKMILNDSCASRWLDRPKRAPWRDSI